MFIYPQTFAYHVGIDVSKLTPARVAAMFADIKPARQDAITFDEWNDWFHSPSQAQAAPELDMGQALAMHAVLGAGLLKRQLSRAVANRQEGAGEGKGDSKHGRDPDFANRLINYNIRVGDDVARTGVYFSSLTDPEALAKQRSEYVKGEDISR